MESYKITFRGWLLIALGGCTAVGSIMSHPSGTATTPTATARRPIPSTPEPTTGRAPGPTTTSGRAPGPTTTTGRAPGPTTTTTATASPAPDSSGLSAKERWWRKVQEDSANAKGEWDGGNGDDGHMKRSHQHLIENCGHDVHVQFDWKSYDMNQWITMQKKNNRPDDWPAGYCVYKLVWDIGDACGTDTTLKSYQRDAIKQLKTVTCHYRPCKDMPDDPSDPGRQATGTFGIYKIDSGGTNVDVTYCESAMNEDVGVMKWMTSI